MRASLYVHVPFCAAKCDYCDFYSLVPRAGFDPYLTAFHEELSARLGLHAVDSIPSIYVGGGTPSLLGGAGIGRLFELLNAQVNGCPTTAGKDSGEITVEANPESLEDSFLDACARSGVTRLSIGIQSLDDRCRSGIGRLGTASSAYDALKRACLAFPGDVSVDLISGLPYQDEMSLSRDIEAVLDLGVAHVSLYSLTVEEGTRLYQRLNERVIALPEDSDAIWLAGRDRLIDAGLLQYEVSNFAKPGSECLHNLRYWDMESYIGIGPSAVGTVQLPGGRGLRETNPRACGPWLENPTASAERESLSLRDCVVETIIMGFRTRKGVDRAAFRRRFSLDVEELLEHSLSSWRARGYAEYDRPALNQEGLLFLNPFLVNCLQELEGATLCPRG